MSKSKQKNLKLAEAPKPQTDPDNSVAQFAGGERPLLKPLGASGTDIMGGYFNEEYLLKLRGRRGAKVYDEMRRSESQVSMLANAIMNPIKSATWQVQAARDIPNADVHAAFIEECRTKMIDWPKHIHEALTFWFFGYSIFEVVHQVILGHPKFGDVIGLKGLAFRSQKTIERWKISDDTGQLEWVEQWVQGDTVKNKSAIRRMEAKNLLVMSINQEGDNYEGIGALRPMYGAYFRKALYQKILAMGIEQNAKGTVVGTTPAGIDKDDEQLANFKRVLQNYVAHESAYILKPEGWEVTVENHDFDPEKLKNVIVFENTEMINAACANFLALGTNGGGGAFALSNDLSDFMLNGIKCVADIPKEVWNRVLIPSLIKMNFGPQENYPTLEVSDIDDKAGKELAEIIKSFIDGKVIKPDDKLEENIRKRYRLPEADPKTARESAPANPFGEPSNGGDPNDPNKKKMPPPANHNDDMGGDMDADLEAEGEEGDGGAKFAESYPKLWKQNKEKLKKIMQDGLNDLLVKYEEQLRKDWAGATSASKPGLALRLSPSGLPEYKRVMREALAEIAAQGLERAKKQTPWLKKKIKLSESIASIKLAAPKGGYYEALPPKIKRIIKANADLIAETQNTDIAKLVSFQYGSSLAQDNIDQIIADIEAAAIPVLEGSTGKGFSIDTAAGNAVSTAFGEARTEWFFEPEVFETIESFTYYNEDPVSEICQQLVGVTLAANDPLLDTYATPLHHNCDGEWQPNLKGAKDNPAIKRGGVPLTQKALDSITLCECGYNLGCE